MTEQAVIIVAIEGADLDQIKELCEAHGLKRVSTLARLRTIRGYIDASCVTALKAVPGVRSVELERQVQLRSFT